MKIRFTLDADIDAVLIAKIKARAGKNSIHKAALAMMREWSYFEEMAINGQKVSNYGTKSDQNDGPDDINLDGLESLDLEF